MMGFWTGWNSLELIFLMDFPVHEKTEKFNGNFSNLFRKLNIVYIYSNLRSHIQPARMLNVCCFFSYYFTAKEKTRNLNMRSYYSLIYYIVNMYI